MMVFLSLLVFSKTQKQEADEQAGGSRDGASG